MFVSAIEKVNNFTRPIHTITRTYGGLISPGTATFFFVNEDGVAITCKHVMDIIAQTEHINQQYKAFKDERDRLVKDGSYNAHLQALEQKFNLRAETLIQIKNAFRNSFDKISGFHAHVHPTLDLAIIRFDGFQQKFYSSHATFVSDPHKVKQGRSLCRLGYPFPEFNNFAYDHYTDDIEWNTTGMQDSPSFPIDGIITRYGALPGGQVASIEMSTPGLRGQSGGPLFDVDGLVYGMQSMTQHLHLGFDIHHLEIINNGTREKVSNYPFLHVGHCVHVDRIKDFLREHNVKFYEE